MQVMNRVKKIIYIYTLASCLNCFGGYNRKYLSLDLGRRYSFGILDRGFKSSYQRHFSFSARLNEQDNNNNFKDLNAGLECEDNNNVLTYDPNWNNIFTSIIPSNFIFNKQLPLHLYFDTYQLQDKDYFSKIIDKNIEKSEIYTVFIKVRYNVDSFFMAGSQFGIQYNNDEDINHLLLAVNTRLEDYFSDYNLSDNSVSPTYN